MKLLMRTAAAGLAAGLVLLAVFWYQWTRPGSSALPAGTVVKVRIPRHATWSTATDSLVRHHLLEDPLILKLGVRLLGKGPDLRAGLYELGGGISPRSLVETLTRGATVPVRVTLPEGWNVDEIAREVQLRLEIPPARFLAVADSLVRLLEHDGAWRGNAPLAACDSLQGLGGKRGERGFHICEGFLAPDTYLFAEGSGPVEVAGLMVRTQRARLSWADSLRLSTVTLDPFRLLTLASIIQAEVRMTAEGPLISAVYHNRLARGWKLEADPTVAYVLDRKGKRLFHKDLEVQSPYNTYRHKGLPPGPIGNPGKDALSAAARPDTTCRAMFFVSDGAGGHVFSRTAAEHARAVARFRKVRAQTRRQQGAR